MGPHELIEKALRKHMRLRLGERAFEDIVLTREIMPSGAEAEDAARIAAEALAGAGLVVVSAEDLRLALDLGQALASTVHAVTLDQHADYVNARNGLRAALPERNADA